jgi:hypothetical protein
MFEDLIAKLEFWYVKKRFKIDKQYTFFLDLNGPPGSFAIKLLGKYEGVIVEFTDVKVGDNNLMTFDYDIISNVNNVNTNSKSFQRFTSNVMRSILLNAIENTVKEGNENRNTDLVESDSERVVHEEIASISEERVPDRKPRKKTIRGNKKVHSEVQQSAADGSTGNQP